MPVENQIIEVGEMQKTKNHRFLVLVAEDEEYNFLLINERRNNSTHNYGQHWNLDGKLDYFYGLGKKYFVLGYGYQYKFDKTNNRLYRLDRLENIDSTRYDMLPSSADALASVLDKGNSYHYSEYQNIHTISPAFYIYQWIDHIDIKLPIRIVNKNLYYHPIS